VRRSISVIFLFTYVSLVQTAQTDNAIVNRLNFGVVAKAPGPVSIIHGFFNHIYHLRLPERMQTAVTRAINITGCQDFQCTQVLTAYRTSRQLTAMMRNTITALVTRMYMLIGIQRPTPVRATGRHTARNKRGAIDCVGDASSWLFGTATIKQINEVRQLLIEVKTGSDIATSATGRIRDSLSTFEKLENKRIDDLHTVMDMEQKALGHARNDIDDLRRTLNFETGIMTYLVDELRRFTQIHDSISELATGIDDLVRGELSPHLLPVEEASKLLIVTRRRLKSKGLRLVYETVRDVYQNSNFAFHRELQDLFVILRLPYSQMKTVESYHTISFPMTIPGKPRYITEVKDFPRYVISDVDNGVVGEVTEIPRNRMLSSDDVMWHTAFAKSCLFEIMTDNSDEIHKACDFSVRQGDIIPSYVNLGGGKYVLSNAQQVGIQCREEAAARHAQHCVLCILHLNCTCSLTSHAFNISNEIDDCAHNETSDTSLLFAINLPIINHFYDTENLTFNGADLFLSHQIPHIAPIQWSLFSENISHILTSDTQNSYSLTKIANSIQNESDVILHNPSEALLYKLLEQRMAEDTFWQFNTNSWMTWMILILVAIVIIGGVVIYRLNYKLKIIMAMVSINPLVAGVRGEELVYKTTVKVIQRLTRPQTTTQATDVGQSVMQFMLNEVRYIDALSLILFSCMISTIILLAYLIRRNNARRSTLYLQIRNKSKAMQLRIMTLSNGMRYFCIHTPSDIIKLEVTRVYMINRVHIVTRKWHIKDSLTGEKIAVPSERLISPWQAVNLQRMLQDDEYTFDPRLIHSHEFNYLTHKQRVGANAIV